METNRENNEHEQEDVLRVRSYRLTDQMVERIREIAKIEGGNQQAVFEKMLEAYEWRKLREAMPEREENLDQFERYAKALMEMYHSALEESSTARMLASQEIKNEMRQKTNLIDDLNQKLSDADAAEKASRKLTAELREKLDGEKETCLRLEAENRELKADTEKVSQRLEEKDRLLAQYAEKDLALSTKRYEMEETIKEQKEQINLLQDNLQSLRKEAQEKEDALEKLQKLLDAERAERERLLQTEGEEIRKQAETEKEMAILNTEKKYLEENRKLMEEIRVLQNKYMKTIAPKNMKKQGSPE